MKRHSLLGGVFLTFVASTCFPVHRVDSADKVKFPYSPVGWESLAWYAAKDARLYDKYGLDVELFFQGASSELIQSMLAGEANLAGIGGPAVISNVIAGGDARSLLWSKPLPFLCIHSHRSRLWPI